MSQRRTFTVFGDRDVLGFDRLSEDQMAAVVRLVKQERRLREPVPECNGTGCIIAGGGPYARWAWASAKELRRLGWPHEIQVWHLGKSEITDAARRLFDNLDVELVDALVMRQWFPHRMLRDEKLVQFGPRRWPGWVVKVYAAMRCPFRNVLFLDADCFAVRRCDDLFADPIFKEKGALFFRDIADCRQNDWGYSHMGILPPEPGHEWEAGCWAIDKARHWTALQMNHWLNEHADVWYKLGHGDKSTMELAWRGTDSTYHLETQREWSGFGIRHFWRGAPLADHCMAAKRREAPLPQQYQDLLDEFDADEWSG